MQTASLVETLPLAYLHVFPYSDRPVTPASALSDKVPGTAIRERSRRLRAIGGRQSVAVRTRQRGTTRRALTVDDGRSAVTDNYLKVALPAPHPRNQWLDVMISGDRD